MQLVICVLAPIDPLTWRLNPTSSFFPFTMPPTAKTTAKSVNVEPPAQIEQTKTRASRRKAQKVNTAPSELGEGGIPTTTPAATCLSSPKKQGRKPKQVVTEKGGPASQNIHVTSPKNTEQPANDTEISSGLKLKAPVPTRDPLPAREGRNTHPGLHAGLQPTPRRSSQEVAAEREQKQLELVAKQQAGEGAKQLLAQMELKDERVEEAMEEEGCRRWLFHPSGQGGPGTVSSEEDFDLDLVDDSEGEEEDDLGTEKEVSRVPLAGICNQLLTILGQVEAKEKGKGKAKGQSKKAYMRTKLQKEITDKAEALCGARKKKDEVAK